MSTEANPRLTLVFEVLGRGFMIQRVILIFGIESESKVNRTRLNSFWKSPVVKQYHPLPSSMMCYCVVS